MRHSLILLSLLFVGLINAQSKFSSVNSNRVFISGRYSNVTGGAAFEWPGTTVAIRIKGITQLQIEFGTSSGNFDVFYRGDTQATQMITLSNESGKKTINLNASRTDGWIFVRKNLECGYGKVVVKGFWSDADPVEGDTPYATGRRIEWIGDSLTVGYGNLGPPGCTGNGENTTPKYSYQDNNYAWSTMVSDRLSADRSIVAWSGKGIMRNYGDPNKNSAEPIPYLYPRSLGTTVGNWNFGWIPDVVIMNLGSNDFGGDGTKPTGAEYSTAMKNFINNVLKVNYPKAKIFVVRIDNEAGQYIPQIAADTQTTVLDLQGVITWPDDLQGCDYHPTVGGHKKWAAATTTVLSNSMGWNLVTEAPSTSTTNQNTSDDSNSDQDTDSNPDSTSDQNGTTVSNSIPFNTTRSNPTNIQGNSSSLAQVFVLLIVLAAVALI